MPATRILLIDTEQNVLLTYKTALEEEGFHIEIALSEQEAREKLSLNAYEIVISEFYLRGAHTLDLFKYLQSEHPDTYIIMTLASVLPLGLYKEALEAGVQDCFSKPFPIPKLLFNIKKGLLRRGLYIEKKRLEEKIHNLESSLLNQEPELSNHFYFIKTLHQELRRSDRFKHPFSLLLMEGNGKQKSDLQTDPSHTCKGEIEQVTLSTIRRTDIVTHYNGTYSFILPETSKSGINYLRERLTNKLLDHASIKKDDVFSETVKHLRFTCATFPDDLNIIQQCLDNLHATLQSTITQESISIN